MTRRVQAALRAFELMLLREIGLLPDLELRHADPAAACEPDGRYALLPEAGVVRGAPRRRRAERRALVGLQAALEHGSLRRAAAGLRGCAGRR